MRVFIVIFIAIPIFASYNPFFVDKYIKTPPQEAPQSSPEETPQNQDMPTQTPIPQILPIQIEPQEPKVSIDTPITYVAFVQVNGISYGLLVFSDTKLVVKKGDSINIYENKVNVSFIDDKKIVLSKNRFEKTIYFSYKK